MSDHIEVKLQGHREVLAALRDLRDYLPKRALPTSVRRAAKFLQGFIVLAAPRLTGRLARNISVRSHRTAGTVRARVIVNTVGKRGDARNAFYWRFLEKGFHTARGLFIRIPFVSNVFNSKNVQAAQMVIDSVEQAIDRAEKKARRALP